MNAMLTASNLERAEKCPRSFSLPQSRRESKHARNGKIIHWFLQQAAKLGREAALAQTPPEHLTTCAAINLEALPHRDRSNWSNEVALAYSPTRDDARVLESFGERDYSRANPGEICGTADVVGVSGQRVIVLDVKTGWRYLGPPKDNLQLLFYALAAARAEGLDAATVGYIWLRDGEPHFEVADVSGVELSQAGVRIAKIAASVAQSETLPTVEGEHCTYCPAFGSCPSKTTLIKEGPGDWTLDTFTAPMALERLELVEQACKRVREIIEQYARSEPIKVGNRVFGPVLTSRESIDAEKAEAVLVRELGPSIGLEAIEHSVSKTSVKRAVSMVAGGNTTKETERVIEALRQAGAVKLKTTEGVAWRKAQ